MRKFVVPYLAMLAGFVPCFGQNPCTSGTTCGWGPSQSVRLNGNQVKSYGQTWATGSYPTYWTPVVNSTFYRGGHASLGPTQVTASPGATAEVDFTSNLQLSGVGSYQVQSYHSFTSATCGPWSLGNTVGNIPAISRPVISRGAAPYYLGGPSSGSDYTAVSPLTANGMGATEIPVWSFQAGSGFGQLACNSCSTGQAFTATRASTGCGAYDVVIKASFGGFDSDSFYIDIRQPNTLQFVRVDQSPPSGGGWESIVDYRVFDNCTQQMTNVPANEVFTSWNVYNSANWTAPLTADGFSNLTYDSSTGSYLLEDILFETPPQSPNPVSNGSNSYDESGASLMTRHSQKWRVGSTYNGGPGGIPSTSGGPTQGNDSTATGILVQSNLHFHYLDHGNHGRN